MYLGVDLGTSSIKLLVMDSAGNIVDSSKSEYENRIENEVYSTQNPSDWIEGFNKCLSDLDHKYVEQIKSLSISGQMHGLVCLDSSDNVIYPAILWNDGRSIEEVELLNSKYKDIVNRECDNIALSGFTGPKLMWLRNNEPEVFKSIDKIMLPKDYLNYYLTKEFVSEVSDASGTLYFDIKNKQYSDAMLEIFKLEKEKLPKVIESYELVGEVRTIDTLRNVKVYAGGGDQAIGAIGVGCVNNNDTFISLGTSGVIYTCLDNYVYDKNYLLHSFCDATGKYLKMGVILNAAGALSWWANILGKDVQSIVNNLTFRKSSVLFFPYLMGERTPINNSSIRGKFDNLSLANHQDDLTISVLEGVCFCLKRAYDLSGASASVIRITGGGAKSKIWTQMMADIFNTKIERIEIEEGPAFGAAILAYASFNEEDISKAVKKVVKIKDTVIPGANVEFYKEKYTSFYRSCPGKD